MQTAEPESYELVNADDKPKFRRNTKYRKNGTFKQGTVKIKHLKPLSQTGGARRIQKASRKQQTKPPTTEAMQRHHQER